MDAAEAERIVETRLLGEFSLRVQVRDGDFVNESEVDELLRALNTLTEVYRAQSCVPKILALALVDISAAFDNRFYSPDQQEQLEDLGQEIRRLAEKLFS